MDPQGKERKPKVVIIGGGIAGLAAAQRLATAGCSLQVVVLEASNRIGGRICSSEFGGERIELGATWIHGIEGSPIHKIAAEIQALEGEMPWECMDGYRPWCLDHAFSDPPVVRAEGGLTVDNATAKPIISLYKQLISEVNLLREKLEDAHLGNLGSFLRWRLSKYLQNSSQIDDQSVPFFSEIEQNGSIFSHTHQNGSLLQPNASVIAEIQDKQLAPKDGPVWDLRSLQEGVFSILENVERTLTAADSLYDLDLPSFHEYWEFPGEQITIGKGFISVVEAVANSLPKNMIEFGKKVEQITWNCGSSSFPVQLNCQDGTVVDADHVIITVSLGVLKAGTKIETGDLASGKKKLCTSVECKKGLFQPPLPDWKIEAISRLGFGVVDKLFLKTDPLPGKKTHQYMQFIYKKNAHTASIPRWVRKTYSVYPIHRKSNVLVAWITGKEALEMEALSQEDVIEGMEKTLSSFGYDHAGSEIKNGCSNGHSRENGNEAPNQNGHSSDDSKIHCIARSQWGSNPLFYGSYSYVAVGSSGLDIDLLSEPLPRLESDSGTCPNLETSPNPPFQLLFAGEATNREQYSTTHGAYFTGIREADRLLQHYGLQN